MLRALKKFIKKLLPRVIWDLRIYYLSTYPRVRKKCPICLYYGFFRAICPQCESLPRHRLFWLWWNKNKHKIKTPVLHFAPDESLSRSLRSFYGRYYKTADLFKNSDLKLDLENLSIESKKVGTIICHHVLEHVDDRQALKEINRVLVEGGTFICSVPIIEGWEETYENNLLVSAKERQEHFGQDDHLRYYGRDFRGRLTASGLSIEEEYVATPSRSVQYALERGERIFICSRISP
jgi:SAM-dependent methyltransferase